MTIVFCLFGESLFVSTLVFTAFCCKYKIYDYLWLFF